MELKPGMKVKMNSKYHGIAADLAFQQNHLCSAQIPRFRPDNPDLILALCWNVDGLDIVED